MVSNINPLTAKLELARAKAAQFRREAFVDGAVMVLRFRLKPVTLYTHNALLAEANHFAVPGVPLKIGDIASFIWLHHASYNPYDPRARGRFFRRVLRRIYPLGHQLNDRLRSMWPKLTGHTVEERINAAVFEIRHQMAEALRDFPRGSDEGEPLPFSHQAYLLNTLRRQLRLPFAETLDMPLKRLSQHLREMVHHNTGGRAMQLTEEEAAVWAEDLRIKSELASTPEAMRADEERIKEIARNRMKQLGQT